MGQSASYAVIVRRGETQVFESLSLRKHELGVAEVIWDRRVRDRRVIIQEVPYERRRGERRGDPGPMWETLGFMVVRKLDSESDAPDFLTSGQRTA